MYVPSKHFNEPEQEIVCTLTGESYVYLEGNDLSLIDPKYHDGAIEQLPQRFYQSFMGINQGNGNIKIMIKQPYDY